MPGMLHDGHRGFLAAVNQIDDAFGQVKLVEQLVFMMSMLIGVCGDGLMM